MESKTTNTLALALQKNVSAVGCLGKEVVILLVLGTRGDRANEPHSVLVSLTVPTQPLLNDFVKRPQAQCIYFI